MLKQSKSQIPQDGEVTTVHIIKEIQALRGDVRELRGWVMSIMVMLGGAALSLVAACF